MLYLAPLVLLPGDARARAPRDLTGRARRSRRCCSALLVLRVPWNAEQGPFGFFVSPVEMFYTRAIGLRLGTVLPGDPATRC